MPQIRAATLLFRLLLSIGFLGLCAWLAWQWPMRAARADIYMAWQSRSDALLQGLALLPHAVGTRDVVLNGQPLQLELARGAASLREIADAAERQMRGGRLRDAAGVIFAAESTDAGRVEALLASLLRRPWRFEGSNFVLLVQLADDRVADPLAWLAAPSAEGGPGNSGAGVVLLAQRDDGATHSDVFLMRFDPGFDPWHLVGQTTAGDVPGYDLPALPRPAGAVRVLSVSERTAVSEAHIVAYRSPGAIANRLAHYDLMLRRNGFHPAADAEGPLRHYLAPGAELALYLDDQAEAGNGALDLIQLRRSR